MKPLNLDNKPCSPISSNCVIWQGPNIPCIKLCTGDTVSDVIAKLAAELCTVLDILNVTNYDLSCFNLTACAPNDFQALIQFLIEQICATETEVVILSDPATSPVGTTKSTGADTLVTVADCFVIAGVTVMTVSQYAQAIGERVCSLVTQISTIEASITSLDVRVTALEAAPVPTFTLPSIPVDCTLSGTVVSPGNYPIDTVLNALVNDNTYGYCALKSATGEASAITAAVLSQCITDADTSLVYGTAFSVAYAGTWVISANLNTAADAINNLWIAICDVYNYVSTFSITVADTATVNLDNTGNVITANITDTGWVDLQGFAYYGVGVPKPKCRRIGNAIHFKGTVFIPLENPSSPGSVVVLSSTSAYNAVSGCTTWSGVGGCTIDAFGAIYFNNGGSVIPTSVTTNNIDDPYSLGWIVAVRPIDVDATYGTCLTSICNVTINTTNNLQVQLLHDVEITSTRGAGVQGNSPLRFATSNVRVGEYLPNYIAAASDIHNAPSNANFPLVSNTFNLTWPFSCDAGDENQVGGFYFKLDGLIAYLNPCNTETGLSIVCP
jgi:hypothetical protein